jgi:hypothetical protein
MAVYVFVPIITVNVESINYDISNYPPLYKFIIISGRSRGYYLLIRNIFMYNGYIIKKRSALTLLHATATIRVMVVYAILFFRTTLLLATA